MVAVKMTEPSNGSVEEIARLLKDEMSIKEVAQMEMSLVVGGTESKRSRRTRSRCEN